MNRLRNGRVGRRAVMCSGGAIAFASLLDGMLTGTGAAQAPRVSGAVPVVDRLAVRVVVDSYQIAIASGGRFGNVEVQRFGWGLGEAPPDRTLISEFGLSLHAESRQGDQVRNVLVDFGFTATALNNNAALLGVDPGRIDALVLSHGHYDHFGGLAGFLRNTRGRLKPGIPLLVGGEECFCARRWTAPPGAGNFGVLDRHAISAAALTVTAAAEPSLVADHAFTTGQVPTISFEKLLSPTRMTIGMTGGLGCYPARLPKDEQQATATPDQFRHEIATAYNLKGRGLIVLTSCSHRGVINVVRQAQAASGVSKVHAVLGGFHLAPYKPDYVAEVVAALKQIGPDYIVPMHCTGEPFWDMARREMPGQVLRAYTGTRFVFNA